MNCDVGNVCKDYCFIKKILYLGILFIFMKIWEYVFIYDVIIILKVKLDDYIN